MSMASTTSSRPSSNPRDSPVSASGRPRTLPNGLRRGQKAQQDPEPLFAMESNTPDQHTHDRMLFLSACAVGHNATIATNTGESFSGIFSGASLEKSATKYVLKMTKRLSQQKDSQANGNSLGGEYIGHGDDHVMVFDPLDIAVCTFSDLQISKPASKLANGTANFKTDTDISGNLAMRERELKPWDATSDSAIEMSLNANGSASWDQFEANERLYGVKTNYDENMYTTSIDRSHPTYRQRALAADRKAREIEGAVSSNVHRAALENEFDEEERFSGVKRDVQPLVSSNPNSYKPPARRAPTGNPTVCGAPVDPAIISSQLARPDAASMLVKSPSSTSQNLAESSSGTRKENIAPDVSQSDLAQDSLPSTTEQTKTQALSKPDLMPGKLASPLPSPGRPETDADNPVGKEVLRAFKDFSAHEKMRVQEKQRTQGRKEREVKINDLKKFASNFKLSKPVPDDLIGILAKDPKKQDAIVAKANRAAEDKKAAQQKPSPSPEPLKSASTTPAQTDATKPPVIAPIEPSGRGRGQTRGFMNSRHEKFNSSFGPGGVGKGGPSQSFGLRKMQQYPPGAIPLGPTALQTDLAMRQPMSGIPSSASSASRFNANALEFRPNPTASTFSPSANPSSITTSIAGSRPVSKAHSPTKRSFFDGMRPKHFSERPSVRDDFNPIKRMKKEAEADPKKSRDNGGIHPAYATKPTWDTRPENENRSAEDMFKQQATMGMPQMMGSGMAMAHQHQLPLHLQQQPPHMLPPHMQGPHPNARFGQPPMQQNHQYHHDDHRMQVTASQQSYHSPRTQPGVMAQGPPMHGQHQPYVAQSQGVYMGHQMVPMGYARPGSATPQMFNQQGQPVMMMNGPPNAQYMQGHGQPHMHLYSPNPGPAFPVQQGPGTPTYSPRAPPMMMHQGSQQGHNAPMMYMSHSQQGQPLYYNQPQNQQMHMRAGGYPMQQQASYGASPHMQHQYQMPHRGPQQYGNFPQLQMHPGQAMNHPNGGHGEVK